jgi:hypothetical protein
MANRAGVFGTIGVAVGFIAMAITLIQFFYGPIHKNESSFLTTAKSTIHSILSEKHASTQLNNRSNLNIDNTLSYTSILFAFLAIVFGTVAYIRDAKKELAYASLSVGAATLFFHFILIALGVVIILGVIVYILNN